METTDRGVQYAHGQCLGPSNAQGPMVAAGTLSRARNAHGAAWPINGARSFVSGSADPRAAKQEWIGGLNQAEVRRRVCHILPGTLAFLLPFVPHTHPLSPTMLTHLTALAVVLALGVVVLFRKIARPGEQHWLLNILSYPAAILATLFLFPGHPEFGSVVLVVLAFGDGSATLFGLLKRGRPLPWNAKKTWVGTCAFLLCAAPFSALAYWQESRPHVPVGVAVAVGTITTLVACIAESMPLRVSDNFRVGLAASVGVVFAHAGIVGWM